MLVMWVLKEANVRTKIPHDDRVSPWEEVERLLKIRNVVKSGWGEVLSNGWGPMRAGEYISACHIPSVEEVVFNNPYL